MQITNQKLRRLKHRLITTGLILSTLGFCHAAKAWAHPHSFVNCTVSFVMDETGLVGCRQRWALDVMTTVAVLDAIGSDHDGVLSTAEQTAIAELTTTSLKNYHYFTAIRVNGQRVPVTTISDFRAEFKENHLIYTFLTPCRVPALPGKRQEVKVAVYDDSFYTYIAMAAVDQSGVDPSLDPQFTNTQAPAQRGDYDRFTKTVGVSKFKGMIQVQGATEALNIDTRVEDAAEMAYFHKQIIPQAAVLAFGPQQ